MPCPRTCGPIMPNLKVTVLSRVNDLTNFVNGTWNESSLTEVFLPCDSEVILGIPLCSSWPLDKLIWHCAANGVFSVRSACHLIVEEDRLEKRCSTSDNKHFCSAIWNLEVPLRVRLLAWRLAKNLLSIGCNLARRIQSFNINCSICGCKEESDIHAILECLMAARVWELNGVPGKYWDDRFKSMSDSVEAMSGPRFLSLLSFFLVLGYPQCTYREIGPSTVSIKVVAFVNGY